MAQGDFRRLHQVWSHSGLSAREKLDVYRACIISRLLYGMQVMWLNQAARNKLDAFHARCLRKILGVQHSYWSRISNDEILRRAGAPKLHLMLLEQQLTYFGTLARRSESCPVRSLVFGRDFSQKPLDFERRRGRPNLEWTSEMFKVVNAMFGSQAALCTCISNGTTWRARVRDHCRL